MDEFLIKLLLDECASRAAAHTGYERRFHQALVRALEQLKERQSG
jgi:hypothetical protein